MRSLWKCTFQKSSTCGLACPVLLECSLVEMQVCTEPDERTLWYQPVGFLCPLSVPQARGSHHSDSDSSHHQVDRHCFERL